MATAGPFCRCNAWTKGYLLWRSLVQPWESCITRPDNINAGDDDNPNHLRFRLRLERAGSELLLPGWGCCSRIDVGRPSGKPSTGATRIVLRRESFVSTAPMCRAHLGGIPLRIEWRNMGQAHERLRGWPRGCSYITIAGPARASRNC